MGETKTFLKELEYFCTKSEEADLHLYSMRLDRNFRMIMKELESEKEKSGNRLKYSLNLGRVKKYVSTLKICHNTSLASLINILKYRHIYSQEELEERQIGTAFPRNNFIDSSTSYVYAGIHRGDWLYGAYEIQLREEVLNLPNAKFLPSCLTNYDKYNYEDYFMRATYWKEYMSEYLAVKYENPSCYLNEVSAHERAEFLFEGSIPLSYVEGILCINETAYSELISGIGAEIDDGEDLIKEIMIKY